MSAQIRRSEEDAWALALQYSPYARKRAGYSDDEYQSYMLALYYAARKWDETRSSFLTYARFYILQARNKRQRVGSDGIRFSSQAVERRVDLVKQANKDTANGDVYSPTALGEMFGISATEVEMIIRLMWGQYRARAYRRDAAGKVHEVTPDDCAHYDSIHDPDKWHHKDVERLRRAMSEVLNERETIALEVRWGMDPNNPHDYKTLLETGQVLGVSRERARQIERQAMRKIREWFEAEEELCQHRLNPQQMPMRVRTKLQPRQLPPGKVKAGDNDKVAVAWSTVRSRRPGDIRVWIDGRPGWLRPAR